MITPRAFARSRRRAAAPAQPVVEPDIVVSSDPERPQFTIRSFRIGLFGGLGVLVALVVGGLVVSLSTVLTYVFVALFFALGLDPLVSWLESKRIPRALAITIVLASVLLIFAGLLLYIIPILIEQLTIFVTSAPRIVSDIASQPWVLDLERQLSGVVDVDSLIGNVQSFIGNPNNLLSLGGGILAVGSGIASGVTGAIIVLILTLYFLASLRSMKSVAYRFAPASHRPKAREVGEEITGAVGRYVVGQVSLAAVNGVLTFILLLIIGGPVPALLACVAFLGSLIPLVGTISGAVIISLACLLASPVTALVAAIYYLVYMQVEAYVLSPRIMNRAVSVPGAVVVIAAVAGGTLAGVLGALVAIPVAASVIIVVQKVVFPRQDTK
ncbi:MULTISPECIES: AI-2E family transporter [unclassified Rathayibacter]|jgi:predicted PurR-regulated permease PerM|uniref:AI-2E family transporter n=1 Tax=unclassified Rathayibacter TaxID=2609250 RepID=UPI000F4B33A0|nr:MULTISPECIES: AI-2E family transporter [unclassified Rathayibacter]MCJ1672326.1 AI-2E family transporter [Rathayibacter sp. VKM Ac-2929]MCJ1685090.1 AI-2E family transporter [Rathayibacter sp. VKM Ac-2928]MCJ1704561.1 AI-2E family transporter [Rathayibacter sp. VKM Ac-2926]ROP43032.1 putative PurR-regulated permease PerM [Rathayibacter sp. PhB186]ROS25138.1 putative PurR-regulated permease PerM [Rathayibacter sp. PhB127]